MNSRRRDRSGKPYEIGYGKPPAEHRFQKGTSGNPSGRPKGAKTRIHAPGTRVDDVLREEAYRTIAIVENGKTTRLPMIQAVFRSLALSALKGNLRAQQTLFALVADAEEREIAELVELSRADGDYILSILQLKKNSQELLEIYDKAGRTRPNIVPHPEDIQFDSANDRLIFNGPMDEWQKAKWDEQFQIRDELVEENKFLFRLRKSEKSNPVLDEIATINQGVIDFINSLFPDEATRRKPGFDIQDWREKKARVLKSKQNNAALSAPKQGDTDEK